MEEDVRGNSLGRRKVREMKLYEYYISIEGLEKTEVNGVMDLNYVSADFVYFLDDNWNSYHLKMINIIDVISYREFIFKSFMKLTKKQIEILRKEFHLMVFRSAETYEKILRKGKCR